MIYYVSPNGNDSMTGGIDAPFRTISHAASVAVAGDTVRVHGGVYRECVDPKRGGTDDSCRITYEAVAGERPIIKGSEPVTGWEHVSGTVWRKEIPNTLFGDFNPFTTPVFGDWLVKPEDRAVHLGDVYIGGVSLYEAESMDALYLAQMRISGAHYVSASYTHVENIRYPENTVYQWYAVAEDDTTVLYCNFGKYDPNVEETEISVRACCFFPSRTGINYITVRGFEMAHAATQFAPPTADQYGMIGPHWSCGWIIEDNVFHDAKCSAVSLGKICDGNGNKYTRFGRKAGYYNQQEAVFDGLAAGWRRGNVGSHVVRNNVIYDCGQTGIVGHMGAAFSVIEHNHIYNVNVKQEFWGHEVAGIKLHAAIDTLIVGNNVHNCNLGIWLDWQAQGTRVTKNIFFENKRDMFIEVTHGPCVVDNNILLSPVTVQNAAQGTAYVYNIMNGLMHHYNVLSRATPYHRPHSTEVQGYTATYSGDDRAYNNIILGMIEPYSHTLAYIGGVYDKQTTLDEYERRLDELGLRMDLDAFLKTPQPVYVSGNAYSGYSAPFRKEDSYVRAEGITASISEEGDEWVLSLFVPESIADTGFAAVTAETLGRPLISEYPYEDMDGSPVDLSRDMLGNPRGGTTSPGAFDRLTAGVNKITVWKK